MALQYNTATEIWLKGAFPVDHLEVSVGYLSKGAAKGRTSHLHG